MSTVSGLFVFLVLVITASFFVDIDAKSWKYFIVFLVLLVLFMLLDSALDLGIFENGNPDEPVYFE
ncbi:MAG: hypothetical protein AAGI23_04960 [Bacteroidota bacterium]